MIHIKPKSTPYTLYNILYLIYTKGYKISPFQTYKAVCIDQKQPSCGSCKLYKPEIRHSTLCGMPDSSGKKAAATYSPAGRSTIGADGLNFSVRNGKRWSPVTIAT